MLRIQYCRYGGPEELRLDDVDFVEPKGSQVCVRVMAASVNPMDWVIRRGQVKAMTGSRFPRGLGHDFAGVVEAVGPAVTRLKIGDEVLGFTGLKEAGTFAEFAITDEANAYLKPRALSFEVAAALPIVGATAWTGLFDKAKLRPGQSVFVTGCLGGVGRAATQLALRRGAIVSGNCSAAGRDEALALGIKQVFDYRNFDTGAVQDRYDVVFDTAGTLSLTQYDALLKPGGVALHIVITAAKMIRSLLSSRHRTVFGKATSAGMAAIVDAALEGSFVPKIAGTVPLSGAISAIIALESTGLPKGKVIIVPGS